MNKFIFLDIDGVLNDNETYTKAPYGGPGIDDNHLFQLKHLVDNTQAKIILSSDWRFNSPDWSFSWPGWDSEREKRTWDYLRIRLETFGLQIHGIVPHHCHRRGTEITMYLMDKCPCQYVILDDLSPKNFPTHIPHLVNTDYRVGLTWDNIWEAQEKMKLIEEVMVIGE